MPHVAQLVPPLEDVVDPLLLLVVEPLELDVEPLEELLDEDALLPELLDDVVGGRCSLSARSVPRWGVLRSFGFVVQELGWDEARVSEEERALADAYRLD